MCIKKDSIKHVLFLGWEILKILFIINSNISIKTAENIALLTKTKIYIYINV